MSEIIASSIMICVCIYEYVDDEDDDDGDDDLYKTWDTIYDNSQIVMLIHWKRSTNMYVCCAASMNVIHMHLSWASESDS